MRISSLESDPPMEASKWLKLQALIDAQEMERLFEALGSFEIYLTGVLTKPGEERVSKEDFFRAYRYYIEALSTGVIPDETRFRTYFNAIFTLDASLLYAILASDGRQLIRVSKPVLQLQAHSMDYSAHDGKFRPMIFGIDSILWGIQFSYPQLFLEPASKEILTVGDTFPNTILFKRLQKWIRKETVPTPFQVGPEIVNVPMRLGKACLSWINKHPQLVKKELIVHR